MNRLFFTVCRNTKTIPSSSISIVITTRHDWLRSSEARTYTNLCWGSCGKCSKPGCFQNLGFWSPFGIHADFLRGLTVANSLLATSGLVGTSRPEQASGYVQPSSVLWSRVLFWCGLVVLSLGYFSNYLKVSNCTRYWKSGKRIWNILLVTCFYQFFSSFTSKLLPFFAMDGRHSRSDIDRRCHVCESHWLVLFPIQKHCRWRIYPTEYVGLRWLLI